MAAVWHSVHEGSTQLLFNTFCYIHVCDMRSIKTYRSRLSFKINQSVRLNRPVGLRQPEYALGLQIGTGYSHLATPYLYTHLFHDDP